MKITEATYTDSKGNEHFITVDHLPPYPVEVTEHYNKHKSDNKIQHQAKKIMIHRFKF